MSSVDEMVIKWSMDSKNFTDGLSTMNRSMNVLKSEFNVTSNKLKDFGSETDQLKNKQDYLTKAMELQSLKVETLRKSYDKQVEATGENSREAENLAVKLNNQINHYNKLEKELADTNAELETQSSKWTKVSKNLETASNKAKDFGGKLSNLGGSLTTKVTAPLTAIFAVATKGTEELRMDMSKLETNIKSAGLSVEKTNEQFTYLSAITGESDSSIEALSNLLSSGLTDNQMQQAVDNLSGAVVKFPDTLKIESLADSMQETLATGAATGQYGELLERLGLNLDDFNLGLEKASKSGTAQQYVLDTLSKQGLSQLNEEYKKSNQSAIESAESQQKLQMKFAELGTKLTPVLTTITDVTSRLLDKFLNLDEGTQDNIIKFGLFAAATGPVIGTIGKLSNGIGGTIDFANKGIKAFKKFKDSQALVTLSTKAQTLAQKALNFVMNLNPVTLIITGLVALGATFVILYNKCEWFRNGVNEVWSTITGIFTRFDDFLTGIFTTDWSNNFGVFGEVLNSFLANAQNVWEAVKRVFGGIIDFVSGVFSGDWSRVWQGVQDIFGGIMDGLGAALKGPLNIVIGLINGAIQGINDTISFEIPEWVPGLGGKGWQSNIPKIDYLYEGGIIDRPTFLNGNTVVGDSYKGIGRQAEAVIPLAQMYSNIRNIVREERGTQPIQVNVIVSNNMDSKAIAKTVTTTVKKEITRSTNNYRKGKGGLAYG